MSWMSVKVGRKIANCACCASLHGWGVRDFRFWCSQESSALTARPASAC